MERPDANGRLTTDDRPRLLLIIASTRPGRVGLPVGLVSYGGISGGLRAVQSLKLILSGLKMVPLPEAVPIPWVSSQIDDEGRFDAIEQNDEAARTMFDELGRWVTALCPLRPALASVG